MTLTWHGGGKTSSWPSIAWHTSSYLHLPWCAQILGCILGLETVLLQTRERQTAGVFCLKMYQSFHHPSFCGLEARSIDVPLPWKLAENMNSPWVFKEKSLNVGGQVTCALGIWHHRSWFFLQNLMVCKHMVEISFWNMWLDWWFEPATCRYTWAILHVLIASVAKTFMQRKYLKPVSRISTASAVDLSSMFTGLTTQKNRSSMFFSIM